MRSDNPASEEFRYVGKDRVKLEDYYAALEHLFKQPHVDSYSAQPGHVTDRELELVAGCKRITSLTFDGYEGPLFLSDPSAFRHLAQMPNLHDVWISRCSGNIDGIGYHLGNCSQIESLKISLCDFGDAGAKHLGKLKSLRYLSLYDTKVTDEAICEFGGLTTLTLLGLSGVGIGDPALKTIALLTRLEHLDLQDTNITRSGLASLPQLPRLSNLTVKHLSAKGSLAALRDFPSLEALYLWDCELVEEDFEIFSSLTTLHNLDFEFEKVNPSLTRDRFQRLLHDLPNTYVQECRIGDSDEDTRSNIEYRLSTLPNE